MNLRHLVLAILVLLAPCAGASAALDPDVYDSGFQTLPPPAIPEPEVYEAYDSDRDGLEYTIVNHNPSAVGDIVALVIDVNMDLFVYQEYPWVDTDNNWEYQLLDDPADQWDSSMTSESWGSHGSDLTWRQFFGGIDYPYDASQTAAAYWVNYSWVEGSEELYAFDDPDLAVSPGDEPLDGFWAFGGHPLSTFYVAHIPDAANEFDAGLPVTSGQATPEPATLGLLALGGLALLRRRR
jgi:hypothetical protein